MLINTGKYGYVGIENPRVTGSIPVQATKIRRKRKTPQAAKFAGFLVCLHFDWLSANGLGLHAHTTHAAHTTHIATTHAAAG